MSTPRRRSSLRRLTLGAVAAATVVASLGVAVSASATIPVKPARTWGVNGEVNIILPVGNRIFLGGTFTALLDPEGNAYPASNLAVINSATGAADLTWQGTTTNQVTSMVDRNGVLYIGGAFSKADGVTRNHLAALDDTTGQLVSSWSAGTDAIVDSLAASGTSIFASGLFLNASDSTGSYSRPYVAKFDATSGVLDQTWAPVPSDRVRGLAVSPDGSEIYIAGDFKKVNNNSQLKIIAELSTADPAVVAPFRATATNNTNFAQVFDIAADSTAVYSAVGGSGGACTAMDPVTGARIWSKHANGNLQSVRVGGGQVYCGGHFGGATSFDGLPRQKIAIVNEAAPYATTSFNPNVDSPLGVWSEAIDSGHLYLGGDFGTVAGVTTPHFAEFIDTSLQTPPLAPTLEATPGDSVVHLDWAPPSSDGGSTLQTYNVYRRVLPSGVYGKKLVTVKAATAYDDTSAVDGTTYGYVVTATNALGEGPKSNEVVATPVQFTQTAPSPPQSFTATAGAGSDSLNWSPPASNGNAAITGYNVYRGTASGQETLLASVGTNQLAYVDSAISAGTTYYYEVTATNAIGESDPSPELSTTPTAGVPGPTVLAGSVAPGVVHLSWTYPASDGGSAVTKYVVVRDNVRLVTLQAPTLTYDDTAVTAGDVHVYQIRAVNAVGSGSYSNKVTVTAQ